MPYYPTLSSPPNLNVFKASPPTAHMMMPMTRIATPVTYYSPPNSVIISNTLNNQSHSMNGRK